MERYRPVVDDWESFQRLEGEEQLTAVRKNPLKATDTFEEKLRERFGEVEESSWNGSVYRLPGEQRPGASLMHWMGSYYVQEESAAVPVSVLDPRPGDKVLDMCAAPGGKATQIAARMCNRGTVVANDESAQRMKSLHSNVYRTGSGSVVATNCDGRRFPGEGFDRVLVDAPCTGEGDRYRRGAGPAGRKESEGLAALQVDLLERASELVEEGGRVVYSTCTLTPLENEAVVTETLERTDLCLRTIEESFPHVSGVAEFEGDEYGNGMEKTARVLPHHMDSGVIYVASFEK